MGCLRTRKSSCLHVREKARFGVCGAIPNRAQVHAKKEKARFGVCGAIPNRAQVHARKEKARLDVCGAITDAFPQITR